MKAILCYGDSNTWGYSPESGERYPYNIRWPGVLQAQLGTDYLIIEEGCSGRTTVWDDPIEGDKNGKKYLPACLYSHRPLDLVIIMLGTNDLKPRFSLSPFDIAAGAGTLVEIIQKSASGPDKGAPKILLTAPPPIKEVGEMTDIFFGVSQKSHLLGKYFKRTAEEYGVDFLDLASIIQVSDTDGIHYTSEMQIKLGKAIAEKAKSILG